MRSRSYAKQNGSKLLLAEVISSFPFSTSETLGEKKASSLLRDFAKIKAVRVIAGSLAGMLVAFLLLIGVEMLSAIVHPFPADFGGTTEEVCQHVARYPQWVLALAVPAWGLTAFASTWTAARIGGRGAAIFVASSVRGTRL